MKVYVLIDHICEADIVLEVFSTRKMAKDYLRNAKKLDRFAFESPEIVEYVVDRVWA